MPKIFLKPNSAEYADESEEKHLHECVCDMPECSLTGQFRAPKDRSLNEYYMFCLEHIQEYNKAWDFFQGMAQIDIEDHLVRSTLGDRPTWRYDNYANLENDLKHKAWQTYNNTDKPNNTYSDEYYKAHSPFEANTPEHESMAIMGLEPPLSLQKIKTRYKELAKKYHPDLNGRNSEAEELLKRINMAYTILKLAYEKYEKLETN